MYLLKQWALKSSTSPCSLFFSSAPLLISPQLPIRPALAQAIESPHISQGPQRRGFASLQQCCLYEKSQYSEESSVWAPQSTQSATRDLCTIMSSPFTASTLLSSFFSVPLHPLYSSSLPLLSTLSQNSFLLLVTPPFLLHAWLLAGLGQEPRTAGPRVVQPWMKSGDKYVCGSKSIPAITVTD